MAEKFELIFGILFVCGIAISAFALIIMTQTWFWIAVIAITLINYLV